MIIVILVCISYLTSKWVGLGLKSVEQTLACNRYGCYFRGAEYTYLSPITCYIFIGIITLIINVQMIVHLIVDYSIFGLSRNFFDNLRGLT